MKREGSQSGTERIKIYITIKDLYFRFRKGSFFFFFWSFVFLMLCLERKGDNLYRIGSLLFSYHWFLPKEIALISRQSRITPGPEDWDVTDSASFRDIKILSHLKISPGETVWNLQPSCGPKHRYEEGSLLPWAARIFHMWFTRWGCTRRVLQLS